MNPFLHLLHTRFIIQAAVILDRRKNVIVRNISSAIVLLLLMYAAYLFFHNLIFTYVASLERIGFLLIERLISVTFLVFFIMLIISGFVMTMAVLVKSAETEYLFSMPIPHRQVFLGKFLDILVFGSWAIVAMAAPILFSYARARDFGVIEYTLTGVFILVPYVTAAMAIGAIAAFAILRTGRRWSVAKVTATTAAAISVLLYAAARFSRPNDLVIPFTEDFRAMNIFINNFSLNSYPLTPNFWLIQALRSLTLHRYGSFLLYTSAILTTAALAVSLLYFFADRWYFDIWRRSMEQSIAQQRKIYHSNSIRRLSGGTLITGQGLALAARDFRIFTRQRGQWSQLAVMLALIALYFYNLRFIPGDIDMQQWTTIIAIINFGFCGFIIATMAIRFVFPAISLEGDSFWILATAPLSPMTIFREKFWTAFIPFLVLTEMIAAGSGLMLSLDPFFLASTMIGIFLLSVSLVAIAVGFGATFPDFGETDPSKIASGTGGILAIAVSLAYITALTTCFGRAGYLYIQYRFDGLPFAWGGIAVMIAAAVALTAIAVTIPLRMGSRAMRAREM